MLDKLLIFGLLSVQVFAQNANLTCNYQRVGSDYRCAITIRNPNGLDNFNQIFGQHLPGYSNVNVTQVVSGIEQNSESQNFPSIICDTFRNLVSINVNFNSLNDVRFTHISANAFRNCSRLTSLNVGSWGAYIIGNATIAKDAFINNVNLTSLSIGFLIPLQRLPAGIFAPLTRLTILDLGSNRFGVIHSDWFGFLPNVYSLDLYGNEATAVDENIFNLMPNVQSMNFYSNECANGFFTRTEALNALRTCFVNYRILQGECVVQDVNQEICELRERVRLLERTNREFEEKVEAFEAKERYYEEKFQKIEEKIRNLATLD